MAEIEHFCDPQDKRHVRFAGLADTVMTLFTQEDQVGSGKTVEMKVGDAVAARIIDNETLGYYMARTQAFMLKAGVNRAGLRFRQHLKSERAHYGTQAAVGVAPCVVALYRCAEVLCCVLPTLCVEGCTVSVIAALLRSQ